MSHLNASCHMWMSHVTCEWVMSHVNASCHVWMSYVTCEWVMSHATCDWVMSHSKFVSRLCYVRSVSSCEWGMSHVNETCHTWMRHVTCEWGMSNVNESYHMWMSYARCDWVVLHMKESCHMWKSHIAHISLVSSPRTHTPTHTDTHTRARTHRHTHTHTQTHTHAHTRTLDRHTTEAKKLNLKIIIESRLKKSVHPWERCGYFSNKRVFSVEFSLQGPSSNWFLWKRTNSSAVMHTWSWRGRHAASAWAWLLEANAER